MKKEILYNELENLAKNQGYKIRYEKGDFSGGSCVLKDEMIILINRRQPIESKLVLLARVVGEIELDQFIKPAVREFIEDEMARVRASQK